MPGLSGPPRGCQGAPRLTGRGSRLLCRSPPVPGSTPTSEMTSDIEDRFYPRVFALVTAAVLAVAVEDAAAVHRRDPRFVLLAFLLYPVNARLHGPARGPPGRSRPWRSRSA